MMKNCGTAGFNNDLKRDKDNELYEPRVTLFGFLHTWFWIICCLCEVIFIIELLTVNKVTRSNQFYRNFFPLDLSSLKMRTRKSLGSSNSVWVTTSKNDDHLFKFKIHRSKHSYLFKIQSNASIPLESPFVIRQENITTIKDTMHQNSSVKIGPNVFKTIGVFDPKKIRQKFLSRQTFQTCEFKNCQSTQNLELADAVIFVMPKDLITPKFKRKEGQLWVFYTIEAPSRANWFEILNYPAYKSGYNVTVSFRLDSDITDLYGRLIHTKSDPAFLNNKGSKNYTNIYKSKSKMAAWFVSHCRVRSDRGKFVEKMKTRIDVDIFGDCGSKICRNPLEPNWGRTIRERADKEICLPMLSRCYKFYLAFENTMCRDYVTEKLFKIFNSDVNTIPVVRGGADYRKFFPSGTYIDASDFSTPEELADFLHDLGADEERYVEYLKRKDEFKLTMSPDAWMCELCKILHTASPGSKQYSNIRSWWTSNACFDPRDNSQ